MSGSGTSQVPIISGFLAVARRVHSFLEQAFLAAPVAVLALGFAAGILIDRWHAPLPSLGWLCGTVLLAIGAMSAPARSSGLGLACLCLTCMTLGGWRHHRSWYDLPANSIARMNWNSDQPARVRGIIREVPRVRSGTGYRGEKRTWTQVILNVEEVEQAGAWVRRGGGLVAFFDGERTDLHAGRRVLASGVVQPIEEPANPGAERWSDWWRAQGIRHRMSGEAIEDVGGGEAATDLITGLFGRARTATRARLMESLNGEARELGSALLLGDRDGVEPALSDAFVRTGTMHVLAISGMHLHVFALGLWWAGPVLGLGRKQTIGGIILATTGYALLVGASPSITRAAVMTAVAGLLEIFDRRINAANLIGIAGFVILALNPSDLFNAGAQLSFLGVAGLIWVVPGAIRSLCRTDEESVTPLDRLEWRLQSRPQRWIRLAKWSLMGSLISSLVMWCLVTPLVAHRFHVVPWVAMVLNLPLIFLTSVAMWAGGLALLLDFIWKPLGFPAAAICTQSLEWCMKLVRWGVEPRLGHQFVPSLPAWQMAFCFALLAFLWAFSYPRRTAPVWKYATSILASLGVIGWQHGVLVEKPAALEVDILDVAHGLAVVIQAKDGTTWVYDCGKMNQPVVGRGDVSSALWNRGRRRIDCLVLSHADTDHFNGAFDLIERFAIGRVRIPRGFGTADNPDAARLMEELGRRGIPVEEVESGQNWTLAGGVRIASLAPSPALAHGLSDNARSLVLSVEAQGRRLILTGDLEDEGLVQLARDWPGLRSVDVWLAPHHGGVGSNPAWLYLWVAPRLVVSSQDEVAGARRNHLERVAGARAVIWRTCAEGAIRLRWDGAGKLTATGMRSGRSWDVPTGEGGDNLTLAPAGGE
jgi:competence protein ComEC